MSTNETEFVAIFRLLEPDQRADLLAWVRLACFAENSARKSFGIDAAMDGVSIPRGYPGGNLVQRSKK